MLYCFVAWPLLFCSWHLWCLLYLISMGAFTSRWSVPHSFPLQTFTICGLIEMPCLITMQSIIDFSFFVFCVHVCVCLFIERIHSEFLTSVVYTALSIIFHFHWLHPLRVFPLFYCQELHQLFRLSLLTRLFLSYFIIYLILRQAYWRICLLCLCPRRLWKSDIFMSLPFIVMSSTVMILSFTGFQSVMCFSMFLFITIATPALNLFDFSTPPQKYMYLSV